MREGWWGNPIYPSYEHEVCRTQLTLFAPHLPQEEWNQHMEAAMKHHEEQCQGERGVLA